MMNAFGGPPTGWWRYLSKAPPCLWSLSNTLLRVIVVINFYYYVHSSTIIVPRTLSNPIALVAYFFIRITTAVNIGKNKLGRMSPKALNGIAKWGHPSISFQLRMSIRRRGWSPNNCDCDEMLWEMVILLLISTVGGEVFVSSLGSFNQIECFYLRS